jgi:aminoglycoside 2''-phosphotransferase
MDAAVKQGQVDLAALVARIRREWPGLAFARARLNDLGEDHAVVFLDDAWVFRFPRSAEVAAHGAAERRLLARLNPATPIETPRYELVSSAGDFGGYRAIAGRELTEAVFAALPREAQDEVLGEIGGFLRVLHRLPADIAERAGDEDAAWFVSRYIERRARLSPVLGPALMAAADRFYAALPGAVASTTRTVIHRDFTEDHILLAPDEDRLAGVIDFTDAVLGDPAFDFTFLWAYGDDAPAKVARAYGGGPPAAGILSRSRWWFARYRLDQIWWTLNGDRDYDIARLVEELPGLFEALNRPG